jgi:pimeloyl-ACP methyl ester carboxylesterase
MPFRWPPVVADEWRWRGFSAPERDGEGQTAPVGRRRSSGEEREQPRRSWRLAGALAAALLVLAGVACSSGSSSGSKDDASGDVGRADEAASQKSDSADGPEELEGDGDFYAVPDPLPEGEHGTLVRYQHLDDRPVDGGEVYRVMYLSESVGGDPIVDTGLVVVPTGDAPDGGWKLLSVAHGTTGVSDDCTPSADDDDITTTLAGGIVREGYVVAATDYEGLGTPGLHPYLVGESEGRSVIDAAIAARQLPGVDVGERYAVWGYSQGGHAAVWANELGAEWAPDLDLVGTVAGAPPSEMAAIFSSLGTTPISPDFFYMIVAGYHAAYPEADPALVLTDEGQELLPAVEHGCYQVGDALGDRPWSDMIEPGFATAEPWPTLLAENDPGRKKVDSPLLILHSAADDVVPVGLSQSLFDRLCRLGQVVERRVYEKGQGHGDAVPDALTDGFAWIQQRMAGDPAISTCP